MTAEQFAALGALLYGQDWRRQVADLLGVSVRNVQFWSAVPPARCKAIPDGVAADLLAVVRGRMTLPTEAARMRVEADEKLRTAQFLQQVTGFEIRATLDGPTPADAASLGTRSHVWSFASPEKSR